MGEPKRYHSSRGNCVFHQYFVVEGIEIHNLEISDGIIPFIFPCQTIQLSGVPSFQFSAISILIQM
jgi:hypothetical protein